MTPVHNLLSFATEHLIKLPVHFIQFLLKMRKFLKKNLFLAMVAILEVSQAI